LWRDFAGALRAGRFLPVGDLRGVNAEEAEAELGLVAGQRDDGVPVADPLDLGEEGAGGGG